MVLVSWYWPLRQISYDGSDDDHVFLVPFNDYIRGHGGEL